MTFGGTRYYGDTLEVPLQKPIVGGAADPDGGYWLVASDGGIFTYGNAPFWGSTGGMPLNKPVVGMAPTPDGGGYWLVASDGGVFTYGDASFKGSTGGMALNKPIVGMAATSDGRGYWLVASDGGIFSFGDTRFMGSTGAITLNKPVVGMAATSDGNGYWLVASDGGIFTYGDAQFWGSTGAIALNEPIVAMAPTPAGNGYWLVGQDAGVFDFGDAGFSGSAQSPLHPPLFPQPLSTPIPPVVTILNEAPGPQAAHQGGLRVAFSGDSLSLYEGHYIEGTSPPYAIDDGAAAGCGYTDGAPTLPWSNPRSPYLSPGACALWASQLQWVVSRFHPDVTVVQTGYWETQNRLFDGSYTNLANAAVLGLHRVEPRRGGADRPLRRWGRGPLHLALLQRRHAAQPGGRVQPDRRLRGGQVPLRLHRRPLHGARPRPNLRHGGRRDRGAGPGRSAHHRGRSGQPH